MKKFLLTLTALGAIAACAAAASPNPQMAATNVAPLAAPATTNVASAPPNLGEGVRSRMACDIRATPTPHGVTISAVLNAADAITGDYNMVITKIGASGSSDVNQAGPFQAARGERVTLGETELGLGRGDRFHAVLTLTGADGQVCRQELRS